MAQGPLFEDARRKRANRVGRSGQQRVAGAGERVRWGLAFKSQAMGTGVGRESGRTTSSNVFPSHFAGGRCLSESLGVTSFPIGQGPA